MDKIASGVQTQLVRTALHLTADCGLRVRNITFDGAAANVATAKQLVVDLCSMRENSFDHPTPGVKISVSIDACHMLKLFRNALAEIKVLTNSREERIR